MENSTSNNEANAFNNQPSILGNEGWQADTNIINRNANKKLLAIFGILSVGIVLIVTIVFFASKTILDKTNTSLTITPTVTNQESLKNEVLNFNEALSYSLQHPSGWSIQRSVNPVSILDNGEISYKVAYELIKQNYSILFENVADFGYPCSFTANNANGTILLTNENSTKITTKDGVVSYLLNNDSLDLCWQEAIGSTEYSTGINPYGAVYIILPEASDRGIEILPNDIKSEIIAILESLVLSPKNNITVTPSL